MVDRQFSEQKIADLYDYFAPWGEPDDRFYLELVMSASSVLDVGCGTGLLLRKAREAGHSGRLCGLDPGEAMLNVARRDRTDIEWISGSLETVSFDREFDLVLMTGHAFQVFVTDQQIRTTLQSVCSALSDRGLFAFETRNPLIRRWESWIPENAVEVVVPGGMARMEHQVQLPVDGELVSFATTYSAPGFDQPEHSHSTLRFLNHDTLNGFLKEAGYVIDAQYGYWDRSPVRDVSPEIITLARRN